MLLLFDIVQAHHRVEVRGRLRQRVGVIETIERAGREHANIIDALSNRDQSGAESAMRRHLPRIIADMFGEGGLNSHTQTAIASAAAQLKVLVKLGSNSSIQTATMQ